MLEFALALLIFIFLLFKWVKPVLPPGFPLGPANYPIIGGSRAVSKLDPTTAIAYNKLGQTYGPLTALYFGRHLGLVVNSYDAIMEVLTRDEFNGRSSAFNILNKPIVPSANQTGIICNNHVASWKNQRKIAIHTIQNLLNSDSNFEKEIQKEVTKFLDEIKTTVKEAGSDGISIESLFKRPVVNVLWTALTGNRPKLDEVKTSNLQEIALGFTNSNPLLLKISDYPFIRIFPYIEKIWQYNAGNQVTIRKFLETSVEQQNVEMTTQSSPDQGFVDLISAYLKKMGPSSSQNGDSTYNHKELIETCNDLFGAGAEKTSNYLAFGILYMLLHPEVQEKVHTELDTVVGRDRLPSLNDREMLPYTQAVSSEILRISGPAPVSDPHSNSEDANLQGFKIPKDTIIMLNLYSIHMDKVHWKDPDKFRPERFLNNEGKFMESDRVIPFGFGKRACPGQDLAKAIFYLFFTGMMQSWRIQQVPMSLTPSTVPTVGIEMAPKPFKVIFKPRRRDFRLYIKSFAAKPNDVRNK